MSDDKKENQPDQARIYSMFGGMTGLEAPVSDVYTRDDVEEILQPVAGDRSICDLDDEQIEIFVSFMILDLELEDVADEMRKRLTRKRIEFESGEMSPHDFLRLNNNWFNFHESREEAENVFKKQAEYAMLSSAFWYKVRQQNNCWNSFLRVATGFKVVATSEKYTGTL